MAEVKYESKIAQSTQSADAIYSVASNLTSLNLVKDHIPQDKISDIQLTPDTISFKLDGLGQKLCMRIIEREPLKTIKLTVDNSPFPITLWLQIKQIAPADTRLKATIKTDLPLMFKMMVANKIQPALDQAIDMLAQMPFEQWKEQTNL